MMVFVLTRVSLGEMPAEKNELTRLVLSLSRLCFLCSLLLVDPSFGSKYWSRVGIIEINWPKLCHGSSYTQKRCLTLPAFAGPDSSAYVCWPLNCEAAFVIASKKNCMV